MGDKRRHRVFAEFIVRNFPDAYNIADIAGGHGILAFQLLELGKNPVIIDPRNTFLPNRINRILRKRSIRRGKVIAIDRIRKNIQEVDIRSFDLIVALHPDEATEPAIKAALQEGKDFAIVPCCSFPMDGIKKSTEDWLQYLSTLSSDINVTSLPIVGANKVLWRAKQNSMGIQNGILSENNSTKFTSKHNDYSQIEHRIKTLNPTPELTASIVIPFYLGKSILEKSLISLRNQSYPKELFEVIVVQDEGEEDISELIETNNDYYSIKLIKLKHIGFTPGRSRNAGIKCAKGQIIFSIDFDIICQSDTLWNHLKWFHVSDEVATFGLRKFIDTSNYPPEAILERSVELINLPNIASISNTIEGCKIDKRLPEIEIIKSHPFPCNCFHGCNIAYRKDTAIDIGYWDEDFNLHYGREDMEFGYRLWKSGNYIVYAPDTIVLHQENDIVSKSKKEFGLEKNLELLYRKVPGIQDFRENILPNIQKKYGW